MRTHAGRRTNKRKRKAFRSVRAKKATQIQCWKFEIRRQLKRPDGSPVLDDKGMPFIEVIPLKRPHVFMAYVFNAAQIDGIPPFEKPEYTWDPIQEAERIVRASQADVAHDSLSDPYYDLLTDSIHLPGRECFQSASNYYATLLHELGQNAVTRITPHGHSMRRIALTRLRGIRHNQSASRNANNSSFGR
jgi:antirestriction protein ArdC